MADQLEFDCPRCDQAVSADFYGPCDECRAVLRTSLGGEAAELEAVEYEPKMNVTPNAVASKS